METAAVAVPAVEASHCRRLEAHKGILDAALFLGEDNWRENAPFMPKRNERNEISKRVIVVSKYFSFESVETRICIENGCLIVKDTVINIMMVLQKPM